MKGLRVYRIYRVIGFIGFIGLKRFTGFIGLIGFRVYRVSGFPFTRLVLPRKLPRKFAGKDPFVTLLKDVSTTMCGGNQGQPWLYRIRPEGPNTFKL